MIETNFEKNKSLALLIKKYKELLKDRNIFIEDQIYVEILNIIGEIIEELKYINEIDINRLEPLKELYKNIVERYNSLFQKDINSELDNLNNLMQYQNPPKSIKLDIGKSINIKRTSNEAIKLSNDIDILLNYVNEIIKIVDKYYKLSELIEEKEPNELTTEIAPISRNVNKQSFISKFFNKIKKIFGIKKDNVVAESPYIEVNKNDKFKEQYLIKDSNINLQHIPNEEIIDYIDGKKGAFNKINELFYGLSKPREVILENNDNYYYLEKDDIAYIIADKTNTEPNRYKNTDTIICSDNNQYFRIVSDNTTIVYEEYKAKSYLDNCGLFIRFPLNSKVGREYIKYKERDNGPITEYSFEEERNGMCNINIHCNKYSTENINMVYDSKSDFISGKKPKKVAMNNILEKYEFERIRRNRYIWKKYIYLINEQEWKEIQRDMCGYKYNGMSGYKYDHILKDFGYLTGSIDLDSVKLDIVNLDIIQNGIKATIPDKILQIYSKVHPEIATMILDYGKEQKDKVSFERN